MYSYAEENFNHRPIVGILSQVIEGHEPYTTTIMAAYVKLVEQAGARAVPLLCNATDAETAEMMKKINGVLIPGGDLLIQYSNGTLTDFTMKVKFILDFAKELNDNGIHYPVLAICQGFEQVGIIEAPYPDILDKASAVNTPRNVTLLKDPKETRMFRIMSNNLIHAIERSQVAFYNNGFRIDPSTFEKYDSLKEYDVLAISHDRDGRPMVSSIEHKKYPIYAHQYHPEKNPFVWLDTLPIPHSIIAIRLTQHISEFFVAECRRNWNRFPSYDEEKDAMIQNYPIEVTEGIMQDIYLF